jgi:hypothetical protein
MNRSTAWIQKFRRHFANNVARLGGKDITSERKTIAREAAVLQTEKDMLAQRLAASGNGGSREDLNLFTQLSSNVKGLFESARIIPATVNHKANEERDHAALISIFENLIRVQREEEAERARAAGIIVEEGETYQYALERHVTGATPQRIGGVVIDARANRGVTIEHEQQPRVGEPESPAAVAPQQPPQRTVPRLVMPVASPASRSGPSVPGGLYAGVALDEGADENLSTTERFLLWPGHGRPP